MGPSFLKVPPLAKLHSEVLALTVRPSTEASAFTLRRFTRPQHDRAEDPRTAVLSAQLLEHQPRPFRPPVTRSSDDRGFSTPGGRGATHCGAPVGSHTCVSNSGSCKRHTCARLPCSPREPQAPTGHVSWAHPSLCKLVASGENPPFPPCFRYKSGLSVTSPSWPTEEVPQQPGALYCQTPHGPQAASAPSPRGRRECHHGQRCVSTARPRPPGSGCGLTDFLERV